MKTSEQDNTLNSILAAVITQAQRDGDNEKVAAEAAATAYVAGLAAAHADPEHAAACQAVGDPKVCGCLSATSSVP